METDDLTTSQGIRRQFFALRNGLLADTLRKGGMDQKYIFGLQLPQIKELSARVREAVGESDIMTTVRDLWADRECREARLLAIHLMDSSKTDMEEALSMAANIRTREEADILAFRLVRFLPEAAEIANRLDRQDSPLLQYAAVAIRRFIQQ